MERPSGGVLSALGAALVFGAATPFSKRLGHGVDPQVLAGLLYLGSGLLLTASLRIWPSRAGEASVRRSDWKPLLMAVVFGGMLGPLLLMVGLRTTPAASASLLLNLEAVFTALGAWLIVKEHADLRIVVGMVVIVAAATLLSFEPGRAFTVTAGSTAIVAACLCWGIDNVATRPLSLREPRQVAAIKGVVAGAANVAIGMVTGGRVPGAGRVVLAMIVGFVGYGLSLVLYITAVRSLGTARTGAYYSAAPFVGAGIALIWLREPVGPFFAPAMVLMIIGLAIHLTEHHEHDHQHAPFAHAHRHDHGDEHHAHVSTGDEAEHVHDALRHRHGHTPDDHHLHDH